MVGRKAPLMLSRRSVLASAGGLVVTVAMPSACGAVGAAGTASPLSPERLDSYLAVHGDGSVSVFFGKMDFGHGLHSAIAQIVAEELDVAFSAVTVFMGDTDTSVNQGGGSGSSGVSLGGRQMRAAAAEARRLLVDMASRSLGVPATQIAVSEGVCRGNDRTVAFGELIGDRRFDAMLEWNGQLGNMLYAPGKATPKNPAEYKLVGKALPRGDVAGKVFGTDDYVSDIKLPDMWHARVIRPAIPGSRLLGWEEATIGHLPNVIVLRDGDFLAVTAAREWDAVRAATELKVEWAEAVPPFLEMDTLYTHLRSAPARKSETDKTSIGDISSKFADAARIIEAEYEWPFQSHASMAGACAVAAIGVDGDMRVWSGTQKPHFLRDALARYFDLAQDQVHVKWVMGPGSYGRNDNDDCAFEAAFLARLAKRPIRLQYMRYEGTGWDPKGPASIHRARAAIDAAGNVAAFEFHSRGFSRTDTLYSVEEPGDTLLGQTLRAPLRSADGFGHPQQSYGFPAIKLSWDTVAPLLERGSPLRTGHLRDPVGPQIHFASESFIDEIAAATGADPVAFRLSYARDMRDRDVIRKAAEAFGWNAWPLSKPKKADAPAMGRGIAYAQRDGTRVAVVTEVEIDQATHTIKVTRMSAAHDCGQILNPRSLRTTIEGNLISGISRAMKEEVSFDPQGVTSVDWVSYPVIEMDDVPMHIDIVLIDRPGEPMTGAGEPAIRPVAAAIANAIYDATGIRLRRAPLTPERLKAAMAQASADI
jgi:nicotinate dehydrogenase subunit B